MTRVLAEEKGSADGRDDDYTDDGTVDLKGRPVLRSNTGYEVLERMAYYGIASNLVLYLTRELREGTVKSSNNVTNWVGTVWMTPILGAYIADAHLGRYWTFVISSAIYLTGMTLLTLAVSVPALRPPSCDHGHKGVNCDKRASAFQGVFYCALYIITIGTGGTKPNISTMGADQFDDFEPKERVKKLSFFNWWMFSIFFGTLFSNTFLIYIQDNVGWSLGYGLPTIGLLVSVLVFLMGTPFYRHKLPSGSPFTRIFQVLVAAVRKRNVPVPTDPKELHELSLEEYSKSKKFRIDHTPSLRQSCGKERTNLGMDAVPVTQVEETKQMIKMIPILVATFIPSTLIAQGGTLFVKLGTTLDRSMGPHFDIPPACLSAFVTIFMLITIPIYDSCFVPIMRRYTKNPRGITLLQRMGIGFMLQIIIMIIACFVESKRLNVAQDHQKLGIYDTVPLSIFILLPQFALAGVYDAFAEVAKLEFFYDQAPEGMKSLGTSYYSSSIRIGHFFSTFVLTTVSDMTKRHGHRGWILNNLNISRLDYYFAFLAVLGFLSFIFFLVVARLFVYNAEVKQSESDLREAMDDSPNKASSLVEALKAGTS
ncbi:Protein NRT1/ PTR FAMILY 5.2 [Hibiscus syriacus]|uniref:Protein NRT1/ PTR FAMILY 5.2 n=1 Tax=Hibiscus syriacus TaxID=106335 RepID=A0A6A3CTP2_HIBSY|nr:Protein NRT1/ PTR FAMILY 5.2 [Hibiscus syriacus]